MQTTELIVAVAALYVGLVQLAITQSPHGRLALPPRLTRLLRILAATLGVKLVFELTGTYGEDIRLALFKTLITPVDDVSVGLRELQKGAEIFLGILLVIFLLHLSRQLLILGCLERRGRLLPPEA